MRGNPGSVHKVIYEAPALRHAAGPRSEKTRNGLACHVQLRRERTFAAMRAFVTCGEERSS